MRADVIVVQADSTGVHAEVVSGDYDEQRLVTNLAAWKVLPDKGSYDATAKKWTFLVYAWDSGVEDVKVERRGVLERSIDRTGRDVKSLGFATLGSFAFPAGTTSFGLALGALVSFLGGSA